MDCVLQLANNPIDIFDETTRILIKIADNILSDPSNPKIRLLQKNNDTISKKIVQVSGARDTLIAMGFLETHQDFTLPMTASLQQVSHVRREIEQLKNGNTKNGIRSQVPNQKIVASTSKNKSPASKSKNNYKIHSLPPYTYKYNSGFLREIESYFQRALHYENKTLQKAARRLIPLAQLEDNAVKALRELQERTKREKLQEPEVELQDFLILELLAWFKNEFFTWVNSPPCHKCAGETKFSHMSEDASLMTYTSRIEMHNCRKCKVDTEFPRYNDLSILLETRRGRCGEWANTFTLFCRTLGWDARFVLDQTDHVWTEVYSFSQRRWLHCDPCENVCDSPLMYETGWAKNVTYVMAFSGEEVQDVTWRYSGKHKEVLARRNRCTEEELVDAMRVLREERQQSLTAARRSYLTKRLLTELVELMVEKKTSEIDKQERTSGALDWRRSRGEITSTACSQYVWQFSEQDMEQQFVIVRYSSSRDRYEKQVNGGTLETLEKWESGVFHFDNIFRKVEEDWKKAYICRMSQDSSSQDTIGCITWKFQILDEKFIFGKIEYKVERFNCDSGQVRVELCANDVCVLLTDDNSTDYLTGSREVSLTATLSGGQGNNAWQHAQLCREDLNTDKFTLVLKFHFVKI